MSVEALRRTASVLAEARVRSDYVNGRIGVDLFERMIARILLERLGTVSGTKSRA